MPSRRATSLPLLFVVLPFFVFADAPGLVEPDWGSVAGVAAPPELQAPAAILVDATTNTVLYAKNEDLALPPASLTKLVAIEAVLQAVDTGEISLADQFAPPVAAWAVNQPTGSSLMFLGEGQRVSVADLLLGLAVSSGNDAAVALAHHIDGSVASFAERMNRIIATMGLENLYFTEPAGLSPQNTITARAFVRFILVHIANHPDVIEELYAVESYTYPQEENRISPAAQSPITQHNRNGMLQTYPDADGLKTGFIDESGYHIAATAERDGRRLVALVLGVSAPDHATGSLLREADATVLLDYGFTAFDDVTMTFPEPRPVTVYHASVRTIMPNGPARLVVTVPAGRAEDLRGETFLEEAITAPVVAGSPVGRLVISLDDQVLADEPLLSGPVSRGGWVRNAWDSVRIFFRTLFGGSAPVSGEEL
jgi:D-alanyl-D-alanine carboxypeptidase (penicillin-binding protein 5/6)